MSWVWHKGGSRRALQDWNAPLPPPGEEQLRALLTWERRCRGFHFHPFPVPLEPPFSPPPDGDGRAATSGFDVSLPRVLPDTSSAETLHFFRLLCPSEQKVNAAAVDGWLGSLSSLASPLGFEIVADRESIAYQLAAQSVDAETVGLHLPLSFPLCRLEEGKDALRAALLPLRDVQVGYRTVEFGLLQRAFLPLRAFASLAADPTAGLVAALGQLDEGEVAAVQMRLLPARHPWNAALGQVAAELDAEREARCPGAPEPAHRFFAVA